MTHDIETFLGSIEPDLKRMAYSIADQWPGIEREDIQQEMAVKIIENWRSVSKHKDRRKISLGLAQKAGVSYAANERQFYQANTAEWIYTPKEVRALLAEYYLMDGWEDAPRKPEQAQTIGGDGVSIGLMDIRSALESASEADQALVLSVFHGDEKPTTGAAKVRLTRAIERLTNTLNREVSERFDHTHHEGPGSRQVMSNASARVATSNNY